MNIRQNISNNRLSAILFIVFGLSSVSIAAPITFDFVFTGDGNNAMGVGYVTFEDSLLPNPGTLDFPLPSPAVLDLQITVTGAAMGDGTYGLVDFTELAWDTNGGTLDLTRELVGQPTLEAPWGTTPSSGEAGDFNLFSGGPVEGSRYDGTPPSGNRQIAPNGQWWFTLCAEGGTGDCMVLTSMAPRQMIPTLGQWGFVAFVLLLAASAVFMRKRLARAKS